MAVVFAAVYHATLIANRTGEQYGTSCDVRFNK